MSLKGTNVDLLHFLFGTVLALDDQTLLLIAAIRPSRCVVLAVIYRPLVLECVDPGFLRSVSRAGAPAHIAFLALVVMNLVAGFHALGTLLAVGIMMLPAVIARFWARDITAMIADRGRQRHVSGYAGLLLSFHTGAPSGPAIILVAGALYAVSVLFGPRRRACPPALSRTPSRSVRRPSCSTDASPSQSLALPAARTCPAAAQEKLKVVATFSILGDFVNNVGGDRVAVTGLVGPNGDAHVYQPSPGDAKTLADAKLVFANGLGFEGWIARLVKASGTKAPMIVATKGVKPRKARRAWPRPWRRRSACLAIGRERQDLCRQYPRRADRRRSGRARRPTRRMPPPISASSTRSRREVKASVAKIPADRRRIITTHDAFGYFAGRLRRRLHRAAGRLDRIRGSAKDVARIITQIRKQKIPAVFLENVTDQRLLKRIGAESGARDRRHALFRRPDRRKGPGADLHRHDAAQCKDARRGADELTPLRCAQLRYGADSCPSAECPKKSPSRC